jgi:Gram-negative bacterial TonB protein C-terminal
MIGLLFLLSCLEVPVGAQSALAREDLLPQVDSPPGLLGPGSSVGGTEMPLPEDGIVADGRYTNEYFGFSYRLPQSWKESFGGPPPSDKGYYVLAQFEKVDNTTDSSKGTILITASDKFFASQGADSPRDLLEAMRARLKPVYQIESPLIDVKLGNRTFVRLDYQAPIAELHWRILASVIRCHIVQFIFTSRDTRLLDTLVQSMDRMQLSAMPFSGVDENEVPLCIPDYATGPSLLHRVEPNFAGPRFTNVPARIVIGRNGKVKHIHVISAFPAQAENVKTALSQWEFKPYVRNGRPLEVETGVLFEFPPQNGSSQGKPPEKASQSW